jgi:DnaK suppressor protein
MPGKAIDASGFEKLPKFTGYYSKKDLAEFSKIIAEKFDETRHNLEDSIDKVRNTELEASGDSSYSLHMADQGTDAMEREKAFLFAQRDEKYLLQVEQSQIRLANGTYGICKSCGIKIKKERLRAVPTTNICIECKTEKEKR